MARSWFTSVLLAGIAASLLLHGSATSADRKSKKIRRASASSEIARYDSGISAAEAAAMRDLAAADAVPSGVIDASYDDVDAVDLDQAQGSQPGAGNSGGSEESIDEQLPQPPVEPYEDNPVGRKPADDAAGSFGRRQGTNSPADKQFREMTVTAPAWVGSEPTGNWGQFRKPGELPLYTPGIDYTLVPQPTNIVQPEYASLDRQTIYNAEEIEEFESYSVTPQELFRPDGIAPMGVIGDHTLPAGGNVLVSYRYSREGFDGMGTGTSSVSDASVLADFENTVTGYSSGRHLALLEYAPTDRLTLLGQLPFQQFSLDTLSRTGTSDQFRRTDIGNVNVTALYVLKRWDRQQLHLNLGLDIPTQLQLPSGANITPGSPNFTYPLRPGSGTWDIIPGLTYTGQSDDYSWGAQASGTIRTGVNSSGYRLGDAVNLTTWVARKWTDNVSTSVRLNANIWSSIRGADNRLNPVLIPTNRIGLQGGERLDFLFGANYLFTSGWLHGQRVGIEAGLPAYQSLNGPQPRNDWTLHVGWNWVY